MSTFPTLKMRLKARRAWRSIEQAFTLKNIQSELDERKQADKAKFAKVKRHKARRGLIASR